MKELATSVCFEQHKMGVGVGPIFSGLCAIGNLCHNEEGKDWFENNWLVRFFEYL
jgi:hypothetical protein